MCKKILEGFLWSFFSIYSLPHQLISHAWPVRRDQDDNLTENGEYPPEMYIFALFLKKRKEKWGVLDHFGSFLGIFLLLFFLCFFWFFVFFLCFFFKKNKKNAFEGLFFLGVFFGCFFYKKQKKLFFFKKKQKKRQLWHR